MSQPLYGDNLASESGSALLNTTTAAARQVKQVVMPKTVHKITKDIAPLITMVENRKQVFTTGQDTFTHLEGDVLPAYVRVDGAVSASSVVNVDSGTGIRVQARSTLFNPATRETLRVASVSTDAITLTGTTTIADNQILLLQGDSYFDNESSANPYSGQPNLVDNYVQITKESWAAGGRYINQDNYGDKDWVRHEKDAIQRLMRKCEHSFLFSAANSSASGSDHNKTTGGLVHWISSNTKDVSGALSQTTLNAFVRDVSFRNTDKRGMYGYFGAYVRDAIDDFARESIRYTPNNSTAGVAIGSYQNSHGSINLIHGGVLNNVSDDQGELSGYAFLLNLDDLGLVYWKNRSMQIMRNVQTPDVDGRKDQAIKDFGVFMRAEERFGFMYNITGSAL